MFRFIAASSLLFIACGGSTSTPDAAKTIDAPKAIDAPGSGSGGSGAAFGAACTTPNDTGSDSASCTGNSECESGCCSSQFMQLGSAICTDPCTMLNDGSDTAECPAGSMGNKCNMKGFCRP